MVYFKIIFILFSSYSFIDSVQGERKEIKILGIFGPNDGEEEFVFSKSIEEVNTDLRRLDWFLRGEIIRYKSPDSYILSKEICHRLKETTIGYGGIFGPDHRELTNLVKSISRQKHIPHIDTRWDTSTSSSLDSDIYANLFPESVALERAISDVLRDMNWKTFTLIYDSSESLVNLQEVLKEKMGQSDYDRPTIIMKMLPPNQEDYRPFLKEIKISTETRIMLHCPPLLIEKVLAEAKDVGLLGDYQNFFITSLDAHIIDYSKYRSEQYPTPSVYQTNITTLRLVDSGPKVEKIIRFWNNYKMDASQKFNITGKTVKTETALMRDAVLLFSQALKDMPKNFTVNSVDCSDPSSGWDFGTLLMEKMRSIEYEGFTGVMKFDSANGLRTFFSVHIIESLKLSGEFRTLGTWDPQSGVKHFRNQTQILEESGQSLVNKTLRVATRLVPPYLFRKNNGSGTDAFEGFCKDLLDALAESLKFKYELYIPTDVDAGALNFETGRYSGLLGELTEHRAEMAVCDFTITPERQKAVDFTTPFMSLGIGILYSVAPAKETSYFSFLDPFDVTVWIYLATAYLSLSIALYFIARCTPYEWEGSHPCDREPAELENQLNLQNCLWMSIGIVLQQGSDIVPKSLSTRLSAGMWCFFTLIVTTTYTANLAAFLTTQRMESPIKNVEELANQDKVKYGCLKKGATMDFFKNSNESLYQRMVATMESTNPSVFCDTNQQGVERVLRSKHKYAFFMESSSIEYEEKLHCELIRIGNTLDSKFYGIAVPQGATYLDTLTQEIVKLKESMVIAQLRTKWWRNTDNTTCTKIEDKDKDKLGLKNVGGVFVLLILGSAISFFVSLLEFLWNVRKVAVREKILLSQAFWLELKFALMCNQTTKPVRYTRTPTPSSTNHIP